MDQLKSCKVTGIPKNRVTFGSVFFKLKTGGEVIKVKSGPKVTPNMTLFLTSHGNYVFFWLLIQSSFCGYDKTILCVPLLI